MGERLVEYHHMDAAQSKLYQVFTYIRELTKLRRPPVGQSNTYEWSVRFSALPSYPTIQTSQIPDQAEEDFDGVILRVKRPTETPCPAPPDSLIGWLQNGWDKIENNAAHIPARNKKDRHDQTINERFEEEPERVNDFSAWLSHRQAWQEIEHPVREAAQVFSDFFKLQGQLQRESEKYQLYLGDGHLVWDSAIEPVDHPILLKKVELEFDSTVPEFILRESDETSELYTSLLRHHELAGNAIMACKERVDQTEPHPLANGTTVEFFKFFIQRFFSNGRYYDSCEKIRRDAPAIYRDPILFLGSRTQGFSEALDKLIDALPKTEFISEALLRIVGIDQKIIPSSESDAGRASAPPSLKKPDSIDFLLTKPANKEQERVITRLEQTGSVLVQGPPGTGKSHTIANIIGHLLASGKTVLVSSHTSKALKVVREKVVKPLQPLCVTVLENDQESKAQLEESINGIVGYLSRTDQDSLAKEISQLGQRRTHVKTQLEKLETTALEIRKGEYTDIVVAGEGTPPSDAARKVSEFENQHGWIPGPVQYGAPVPLNDMELQELYKTNGTLQVEDERCIAEGLPDLSRILSPSDLSELAVNLKSLDRDRANRFAELWKHTEQDITTIETISKNLGKALDVFSTHQWIRKVVEDSKLGNDRLQPWTNLIEMIEVTNREVARRTELILKHGPQATIEISVETIETCKEIVVHLRSGGSLGFFSTAFKSPWRVLIGACRIDDGAPSRIEHFEAILALMESAQLRRELKRRWERQVVPLGGPKLESHEPEISAKSLLDALKLATIWTTSTWNYLEDELEKQGFSLRTAFEKLSLNGQSTGYIEQIQVLVENILAPAIDSRRLFLRMKQLESLREQTLQNLKVNALRSTNAKAYLHRLISATQQLDVEGYKEAYDRYLDIKSRVDVFSKRMALLRTLGCTASGWAKTIELRSGVHGRDFAPGNSLIAWKVCQWRQELDRRISQDYSATQREIQRLKDELNGINAQYVEKLAWKFQHARTGLRERQALTGWQQLQAKITKTGKGTRDIHLKREARKTLKDCKNAVPVWIMPLSRVFDSFDLVHTKFDVILLDEASQSDITALVAFAIAKQVIVVGDNEQVTPYAVGQELGKIQSLIDELLQGIPNRMLYDGKTSVYDLAEQAFGETIRLVEHFRCVPDIIEFSNQLSYSGEIRPLRESSSSPYASHLIAHRIDGASSHNKTNQKEATEIASLVCAMTEIPEYQSASIGVISMVGQEQAVVIDSILQRRLQTSEYSRHKLLCGNASQFQGDERDVIVISMVDTCNSPPLAIRQTDDFKKTFNVAASRARNQLWVIHSLNPTTDLKPGDLRLRMIRHAENPKELRQQIETAQKRADPKSVVFEPAVIRDLMQAGFRVTPQFEVGTYTIDMVVEGIAKRIAIECDGDRYHPPEKLADDIQRQMVLERLGWNFIRIRGSEYFRYREATMKRVIGELDSMGIERLGPSATAQGNSQEDELRRKVLQRALEISQEWEANPEPEQEVKPKRSRWGRRAESSQPPAVNGAIAIQKTEPVRQVTPAGKPVSERIRRQHPAPVHLGSTHVDWSSIIAEVDDGHVVTFLKAHGFDVIDKRPAGGCLWVIDDPRFKDLASALNTRGLRFMFAANGSRSTKDLPAWYTKR